MNVRRSYLGLGSRWLLMLLAAGLAACEPSQPEPSENSAELAASALKERASEPSAVTLEVTDLAGLQKIIAETAQSHQVLVIDFWATWCRPCVAMFAPLHTGLKKLGPRVRVISVTLDAQETLPPAVAFLQKHGAMHDAFVLSPDTDAQNQVVDALGKQWDNLVVPAVLVYDRGGQLAGEFLDGKVEPILEKVGSLLNQDEDAARP